MKRLIASAFLLFFVHTHGQMPSYMKLINGGTMQTNKGYEFFYKGPYMMLLGEDSLFNKNGIAIGEKPNFNSLSFQVSVADFYISDHEVSNEEYLEFLFDSVMHLPWNKTTSSQLMDSVFWKKMKQDCSKLQLLPDTACWSNFAPHSFFDPNDEYYFRHPSFRNYPLVGVSWKQANAYCSWLTHKVNKNSKEQVPAFRLPTEMEWEYACNWSKVKNPRLEFQSPIPPYEMNVKVAPGLYFSTAKNLKDDYSHTAPIRSFEANENKLYNMRGNVAEWCVDVFRRESSEVGSMKSISRITDMEKLVWNEIEATPTSENEIRVVKGGSWADYQDATLSGSRTYFKEDQGSARIGFRVAMIKIGTP
ncbi:MAG: SUMF1/EgtB/PvdO family nonheme iron enzyme [Bacteroidota bacterium]